MAKTAIQRRHLLGLAALPWLGACAAPGARDGNPAQADPDGARLAAVLAGAQRSAASRARDAARHPFDTLRFFGVAPGQTVIEVAPGSGWYTEILAPYLRGNGRLYAAHYPADAHDEGRRLARERFAAKLAADPATYGEVILGTQPVDGRGFVDILPTGGVDRVLTFRNVHNWLEGGHLYASLRAFHAVLRPGGVLGIEEHRAPPGTPLARMVATGYVTEALVVEHARAAGFTPAGRSEINANPRDTHDHPDGVWSLPPTLRGPAADRERFLAIGESDRMTLRFVKA